MPPKPIDPTTPTAVRCVVSCRDASGVPTFFPCTIECVKREYDDGTHYAEAQAWAEDEGYEDVGLVYDENDGPQFLFDNLFK